jgi:hypothetical protein
MGARNESKKTILLEENAMNNKRFFMLITAGLLADAVVIAVSQVWGMPLKDVVAGIALYTFMGLLIVGYLLRFALAFLGVFAIYRVLRERYYQRMVS